VRRGSGVRRLCHDQEPTAAAGPRPKRSRAEEWSAVLCGPIRSSSLCVAITPLLRATRPTDQSTPLFPETGKIVGPQNKEEKEASTVLICFF
jgi:hypothetical protein